MEVGDRVKLKGKTKHGKNRVNEQGAIWTVSWVKVIDHDSGFAPKGTKIALLNASTDPLKHWRWVEVTDDKNFHVKIISNDIEELKGIKSEISSKRFKLFS